MTIFTQGAFQSTGINVNIPLQQGFDYFRTFNQTQAATTQATGRGIIFEYFSNPATANYSAYQWSKTNSTNAMNMSYISSAGFNYVASYPQPEAAVAITAITAANPAVVSATNTYNNGDTVIIYGASGSSSPAFETIGGMAFTISSVSSSQFTLLGLNGSTFSNAATAGFARRVSQFNPVIPQYLYVTAVSQASQAVVTVSQDPTNLIWVGQKLEFTIPSSYGMVQLNNNNLQSLYNINYPAVVTAVNYAAYQFTININTTNFTAFSFPTSGSPTQPLFATVAPAGSSTQYNSTTQTYTGYDFNKQPFRSSYDFPYMTLYAGANSPAGSNNDIIIWQCWKSQAGTFYGNGT
ncbi:MAG TPA: hypothetical protein DCP92_24630 [Nitrospiraceae bacterium]|jgi:hypothetical protein|nr:hypothetical protein [Nitrospiraceae bacterium]